MAPQGSRLAFVDMLRGWALLAMIETHVFNAMLAPAAKGTRWFHNLNSYNGLVAPTFLFVSGWVFVVASRRKLEDFRSFGPALRRQLLRIGMIWGLGYMLHIPHFSYSMMRDWTRPEDWLTFSQVDILHCIAVGLLAILIARLIATGEKAFEWTLWLLSLTIIFATPVVWGHHFPNSLPVPVVSYFVEGPYSFFPIFPWLGFLLLGGAFALRYLEADRSGQTGRCVRFLSILGVLLASAGFRFSILGFRFHYGSSNIRAHPLFFGMRLGFVFLLLAACWLLMEKGWVRGKWVQAISRESLLVYVVHMILIFRIPGDGVSLANVYGGSWSVLQCTAFTVGLIFPMYALSKSWTWLKQRSQRISQYVSYATALGFAILFLMR